MKILFLCHRFPFPPEGGGKIRALHMIRHLASRGHDVTLCSLTRSASERQGVASMREHCRSIETVQVTQWLQVLRMLLRLATSQPSSFGYFYSRKLAKKVKELLNDERWDVIIAHCSSMGDYVASVTDVPKLMDFADMDSQKWLDYSRHKPFPLSLPYWLEGTKLERHEQRLAESFDVCTTISAGEKETLDLGRTGKESYWFPNGVDLNYFTPGGDGYDPELICFVGRMDYYPNEQAMLLFCRDVWPKLKTLWPRLRFKIVGADPPLSVKRLSALDGVDVTGLVTDVRPHVAAAALTVAPLTIARGMQNKVLESMALGVPVVASELVARGLGFSQASPVRTALTPDDYVRQIASIIESPAERARLSAASRDFVEEHFSWPKAMHKLDEIIVAMTGGRTGTER